MKKTNILKNLSPNKFLTGVVWSAFGLFVVAAVFSTLIPMVNMLQQDGVRVLNATAMMISLALGLLLPGILAYLVGMYATSTKTREGRHLNSALFVVFAYVSSIALGTITSVVLASQISNDIWRIVVMNVMPAVLSALVLASVAVAHSRAGAVSKKSVIEYRPFVLLLAVAVASLAISPLLMSIESDQGSLNWSSAITALVVVLIFAGSYMSLKSSKLSSWAMVAWGLVSVSMAWVIMYSVSQAFSALLAIAMPYPTVTSQFVSSIVSTLLVIGLWIAYWVVQVKALKSTK